MNVLVVNGSPHKTGGTASALRIVESELKKYGICTSWFEIGTNPVRGCIACRSCSADNRCVFCDDGCNELIERMIAADAVCLGLL